MPAQEQTHRGDGQVSTLEDAHCLITVYSTYKHGNNTGGRYYTEVMTLTIQHSVLKLPQVFLFGLLGGGYVTEATSSYIKQNESGQEVRNRSGVEDLVD